jgi:hypothetical protein
MKFKKTTNAGALGNSVLFNGSSQYLTLPASSNWAMTGNFTVECWINTNLPSGGSGTILSLGSNSSAYAGLRFQINRASSGATPVSIEVLISISGGSWGLTGATSALMVNGIWNHVAVVRSGGIVTVYINGVGYNIGTINGTLYAGPYNTIGKLDGYSPNPFYYNGYISNLRVVNGTALYTSNFVKPTSPLTAITNTSLLTCNAPTIVDASLNNFAITNNGAATVSSAVTPFLSTPGTFKVKKSAGVYMVATGGDLVTTSGSYKIHTFTTVGTSSFTISNIGSTPSIECLLVGGGGAGGYGTGGGGGAGGVLYSSSVAISAGTYNVVVGVGGASVNTGIIGNNGNNTSFSGLTAFGGGGGGTNGSGIIAGAIGGSGGGGSNFGGAGGAGGAGSQPSSSYGGYGNSGGAGYGSANYGSGGGGGAGGAGGNGNNNSGGAGGTGITNALLNFAMIGQLSGSNYYVGGGGGGAYYSSGTYGAGGLGGGGTGGLPGNSGSANTGGGGGGPQGGNPSGAGGSGIVVIKYRYTD